MSIQMSSYLKSILTSMIFYEKPRKACKKNQPVTLTRSVASSHTTSHSALFKNLSKSIRVALQPHVSLLHHKSVQQDFTKSLGKWMSDMHPASLNAANNLPYINGFDFNEESSISEQWKIRFNVIPKSENLLELHIPAFIPWDTIAAPVQTTRILCSVTTAACNVLQPLEQGCCHYSFVIPYDNHQVPARVIPLSIPASNGCLCITTVELQYELKNGKTYNRPAYRPCSIVDARYK